MNPDQLPGHERGVPAHTSKKAQKGLKDNLPFCPKKMCVPYSPDANPLDFTFCVNV
uniref:Uncharacterized protein n=1 Tax=Lepeophtheirus salmonis TaxID=72036 RepID=A0A0K2UU70_LEPSM